MIRITASDTLRQCCLWNGRALAHILWEDIDLNALTILEYRKTLRTAVKSELEIIPIVRVKRGVMEIMG